VLLRGTAASGRQQASAPGRARVPQSGRNGLLFEWPYPRFGLTGAAAKVVAYPALSAEGDQRKSCRATLRAALLNTSEVVS